jgi:hypothetical protein
MVRPWQTNPLLIEGMAGMITAEISIRWIEPYSLEVILSMSQVRGDALKHLHLLKQPHPLVSLKDPTPMQI